jgi:hypothetical protein
MMGVEKRNHSFARKNLSRYVFNRDGLPARLRRALPVTKHLLDRFSAYVIASHRSSLVVNKCKNTHLSAIAERIGKILFT